jgi:hypothetical protein
VRLFDYLKLLVVCELSQSLSQIHLSFDGWTTKGGKKSFLNIAAHYVTATGKLRDLPIALPESTGSHSGERMGEIVLATLRSFGIGADKVGYFVLDNASNNNTTVNFLARKLKFNKLHRRLRCGPHTLNLIRQVLLWGRKAEAFNNDFTTSNLDEETQLMKDWRRNGSLGVFLGVVSYIKTLQQYTLFEKFQQLAHAELPTDAPEDACKILEPIKPVVTRWNSYFNCFARAVKLQSAINAYASHHVDRVRNKTTYAISKGNQLPDCPQWMRSNRLTAED